MTPPNYTPVEINEAIELGITGLIRLEAIRMTEDIHWPYIRLSREMEISEPFMKARAVLSSLKVPIDKEEK